MDTKIPIQNVYYLFLYAWNRFEEGKSVPVGADDNPELADLLAKVLIFGVRHLLRRGLWQHFTPTIESVASIRGKIDIGASLTALAERTQRLVCEFDDFRPNILPNQILRTTMARLARTDELDVGHRSALQGLDRSFGAIDLIRLDASVFRRVQLDRNNAYYQFLMNVCELAYVSTLPTQDGASYRFSDVLRDEKKMALVFQAFVRNFYAMEQSEYEVTAPQIVWDAEPETEIAGQLLPTMNTDVVLSSRNRKIILDTKYYASALIEHHGKHRLQPSNLFQLFAYLKNAEARGSEWSDAEGILLYPATGEPLLARYRIQGHKVTAATINLDQPWPVIAAELHRLLLP